MKEISATELKSRLDAGDNIQVIDVRERNEYEYSNIGGELLPMGEIMMNLDKVSKDIDVVVHCKTGGRSGSIANALAARGFTNIINLRGGIVAWSEEVDSSILTY